jgi:hypothetical protein
MSNIGPVTKHIDTTPRLVITNGSLAYPSIWRGKPSEEIDKAWEDISYNSKCTVAYSGQATVLTVI